MSTCCLGLVHALDDETVAAAIKPARRSVDGSRGRAWVVIRLPVERLDSDRLRRKTCADKSSLDGVGHRRQPAK